MRRGLAADELVRHDYTRRRRGWRVEGVQRTRTLWPLDGFEIHSNVGQALELVDASAQKALGEGRRWPHGEDECPMFGLDDLMSFENESGG